MIVKELFTSVTFEGIAAALRRTHHSDNARSYLFAQIYRKETASRLFRFPFIPVGTYLNHIRKCSLRATSLRLEIRHTGLRIGHIRRLGPHLRQETRLVGCSRRSSHRSRQCLHLCATICAKTRPHHCPRQRRPQLRHLRLPQILTTEAPIRLIQTEILEK